MLIRKWRRKDLPDVYRIMGYIPMMDMPDYTEFKESVIRGIFPKLLVAEKDNKPVGIAIYNNHYSIHGTGYIFLTCLSVETGYRRQGIATELINKLKKEARRIKADGIGFWVNKDNEGAKRFYHNLGAKVNLPDENFIDCTIPV
jgi:ribosomal protein S18 acetylase RimI-like enzyme